MKRNKFLVMLALFFCFNLIFCGCSNKSDYFSVTTSDPIQKLSVENENFASIVSPAIVGIKSVSATSGSIGSGVCVKSGGYIVTNYHVISNFGEITLHLHNGKTCKAMVLKINPDIDIAILKANYSIPYLSLANSDSVKVGETVYAVGTPLSLSFNQTFTKGIVSALNRKISISLTDSNVNYMENLIQHDASINSGNSGGPLLNKFGEVIGINTLKITDAEGLGFAVPVKTFEGIVNSI